jgi:hypothetical protein
VPGKTVHLLMTGFRLRAMRMSEKTNNKHGFEAGEDHISNL